ncbi:MAG: hypothetical protein GXP31_14645 [Kiritimatiellaeota bacterium]|nr:hypothetical protein [Kiritimatiellota bacterium]
MPLRVFPFRECYCPAHFGNSYEAMWPDEMSDYLAEMKHWGFNRYADWITTTDVCNPYASEAYWDLATELLDRKKRAFRAAQALGFDLNLIVTLNHVYLDQLRPERAATKDSRIFGQLVCPSRPEVRRLVLGNFERWFQDFAASGIRLAAFTAFAYDYGGCACKHCQPWILTFARLLREVHSVAEKHHPGIEPWVCSWWWTPEEHALFNRWAADEAPGWLKAMTLHIEYGQTCFKNVPVPAGCRKLAFVHIGYSDNAAVRDLYTKWGAVVAPSRLPRTLDDVAAHGAQGFQAYSEGVFDDVNKALLAGLGSGRFADAEEVLRAYAQRYFDAAPAHARRWAQWMASWGDRTQPSLPEAGRELERLAAGTPAAWRLEHWRRKVILEALDRKIGVPGEEEWTDDKLRLADKFWAEQERLQRQVYGLGPVRHVFARKFSPPRWYDSWMRATARQSDKGNMREEA